MRGMEWGRSSTLSYSLSSADPGGLKKANDATVLAEQVAESSGRNTGLQAAGLSSQPWLQDIGPDPMTVTESQALDRSFLCPDSTFATYRPQYLASLCLSFLVGLFLLENKSHYAIT